MHKSPQADVRMKGFRSRATVAEALEWLDARLSSRTRRTTSVPIAQAAGRMLANAITSPLDVPAFDRSAMDGYAVQAAGTIGASDYAPVRLRVIGESLPGKAFSETVGPQQAVRIMTGAPLPSGADAVVPVEVTARDGEAVLITSALSPGKHVGRRGEDIPIGSEVLPAGRRLRPQDLGVLASIGLATVPIVQPPQVRVIITGNELALPGEPRQPHQIYEANSPMLLASLARDGGELEQLLRVADQQDEIQSALMQPGADLILISGGTSVGAEDYAPQIVQALGELPIHGIAMRPSSPTGLGSIGETLVCLLPGNPVSCLCAYDFFAGRAIRTLAGLSADWPFRRCSARLVRKVPSEIGRTDYCRVKLEQQGNEWLATPLAISGASILSSTTRADGFLVVPDESEGIAEECVIEVLLYH